MTKPEIAGIAPFFIVRNVPAALSFYRDRLGFDITFQGPEPDDIFFGIVQRGGPTIILKAIGVEPGAELHEGYQARHRALGRVSPCSRSGCRGRGIRLTEHRVLSNDSGREGGEDGLRGSRTTVAKKSRVR